MVVAISATFRNAAEDRQRLVGSIIIGVLFGLSAAASMVMPVQIYPGLRVDTRIVFVLVGSLFGGPAGAIIATGIPVILRLYIGGNGVVPGAASIVCSGIIGYFFARHCTKTRIEFGLAALATVGLVNALFSIALTEIAFAIQGQPSIPLEADAALVLIAPIATAVLGTSMALTHPRAIRRAQQYLSDYLQTTSDLTWEVDASQRFTAISPRFYQLLNLTPADAIGQTFHSLGGHWFDADSEKAYESAVADRKPYDHLLGVIAASDGPRKMLSVNGRPSFNERGIFVGYRCTAQNVTELMRMQEEIRRSHDNLVRAQRIGSMGSVRVDVASGTVEWSEELYRIYGLDPSRGALSREAFLKTVHIEDREKVRAENDKNDKGIVGPPIEFRILRPDGEIRWLHREAELDPDIDDTSLKYLVVEQDITERKAAEEEIKNLAFFDPLTGLPNRRLLRDRLRHAVASSLRNTRKGALFFIDLDNFKTLNDTFGHALGDELLKEVAHRLISSVREGDTVARMGGDEFVIILELLSASIDEAASQAEHIGENILRSLNQPYFLAGQQQHSTTSIGAILFGEHESSIDELLRRADVAMYQAKGAGRNTMRFFDPHMQAAVEARATLESDLREGLRNDQFLIYYQPQIDDRAGVSGAEALVRWQHPTRGLVAPADFIPLAEETGLIMALGHKVLEMGCAQLAAWSMKPGMAHLMLAVNVSASQFRHRDFVAQVLSVLDQTGADPTKLKLELTESLFVENVPETINKMLELRSKGVGFSLDDFGTGYSSLSYLKQLPLDQLKIDQSFVRDVLIDPNDAAIARTIVALAHSLGLNVIAEGVETQEQRDFLSKSGCRAYQGYLFGRPVPIDGFETICAKVSYG
jgi:diguanylate cyclase (GGDEF)-like protein/PAS domain S-box-containing protein